MRCTAAGLLVRQTAYVLDVLQHLQRIYGPRRRGVLLVGHSMGGLVAQAAASHARCEPGALLEASVRARTTDMRVLSLFFRRSGGTPDLGHAARHLAMAGPGKSTSVVQFAFAYAVILPALTRVLCADCDVRILRGRDGSLAPFCTLTAGKASASAYCRHELASGLPLRSRL